MSGFQAQVNAAQAPAVAGDFASANDNKYTVLAGPNGIVAGSSGLTQGLFAWLNASPVDGDGAPATASNTGSGVPSGFVRRDQQALITAYLGTYGMTMPAGFPVTLFNSGDFWVKNAGAGAVTVGQKAFAMTADGTVQFAAAGGTISGGVETKWYARSAGAAGELIKMSSTA